MMQFILTNLFIMVIVETFEVSTAGWFLVCCALNTASSSRGGGKVYDQFVPRIQPDTKSVQAGLPYAP